MVSTLYMHSGKKGHGLNESTDFLISYGESVKITNHFRAILTGPVELGVQGGGGHLPPSPDCCRPVTQFQPRGADYAYHITTCPPTLC